jgi:hypothetical protein
MKLSGKAYPQNIDTPRKGREDVGATAYKADRNSLRFTCGLSALINILWL